MPRPLIFSRNRCTGVEQIDEQTLKSTCRLQDPLTDAFVQITVKLPDLEITGVTGEFYRTCQDECLDITRAFEKMKGVRVGPGMLKIIKGLVAEATDCKQLGFMIEECCHGVILSFTKDQLLQLPEGEEIPVEQYQQMVRDNVRLFNRCAAFSPGSSMVEGIDLP
jgi:hypothetical protein